LTVGFCQLRANEKKKDRDSSLGAAYIEYHRRTDPPTTGSTATGSSNEDKVERKAKAKTRKRERPPTKAAIPTVEAESPVIASFTRRRGTAAFQTATYPKRSWLSLVLFRCVP